MSYKRLTNVQTCTCSGLDFPHPEARKRSSELTRIFTGLYLAISGIAASTNTKPHKDVDSLKMVGIVNDEISIDNNDASFVF